MNNLIDNAVRYTPAGGQVEIPVSDDDGAARLEVTDTGPGVPPQEPAASASGSTGSPRQRARQRPGAVDRATSGRRAWREHRAGYLGARRFAGPRSVFRRQRHLRRWCWAC